MKPYMDFLTHILDRGSRKPDRTGTGVLEVGDLIWTGGDCLIYLNQVEQIKLQLMREPYPLPRLIVRRGSPLFSSTN